MTMESEGMERRLPSVDRLLRAVPGWAGLPGPMAAMVVRRVVSGWREAAMGGVAPPDFEVAVEVVRVEMELLARRRIGVVINGTGVLLHTNLGRAPLAAGVAARVAEVASSYHNLELDMETGERGGFEGSGDDESDDAGGLSEGDRGGDGGGAAGAPFEFCDGGVHG